MKLVPPDTSYNDGIANLSGAEHELSKSAFEIIQAFRLEVSEHDEDPGFDFDDALSAIMKTYGFGRILATHFMGQEANIPKDVEAIVHGVVRNLGILDTSLTVRTHAAIPGAMVTEDTPAASPPAPPKEPESKKGRRGKK